MKNETVSVTHSTVKKHDGLKGNQFVQSVAALIRDECELSEARIPRCLLKSDIVGGLMQNRAQKRRAVYESEGN